MKRAIFFSIFLMSSMYGLSNDLSFCQMRENLEQIIAITEEIEISEKENPYMYVILCIKRDAYVKNLYEESLAILTSIDKNDVYSDQKLEKIYSFIQILKMTEMHLDKKWPKKALEDLPSLERIFSTEIKAPYLPSKRKRSIKMMPKDAWENCDES